MLQLVIGIVLIVFFGLFVLLSFPIQSLDQEQDQTPQQSKDYRNLS